MGKVLIVKKHTKVPYFAKCDVYVVEITHPNALRRQHKGTAITG